MAKGKVQKQWEIDGDDWFIRNVGEKSSQLENVIYTIHKHPLSGELFLTTRGENFKFGFKIYGLETDFIDRVLKSYKNTTGNMGVLCNGVKGTGKTVSTEIIANKLELPIILVDVDYGTQLTNFLSGIEQNVIVFVDEYEKTFPAPQDIYMDPDDDENKPATGSSTLLSLMDGTLKTQYRKVFLFTTNKLRINENMINRPSRIRYLKTYSDLNKAEIEEIVDDCLKFPARKEETIEFIKQLELITVDIVKAVVSEINIFDEEPDVCCKNFNVKKKKEHYNIIKLNPSARAKSDKEKEIAYYVPAGTIDSFVKQTKKTWRNIRLNVDNLYLECMAKPEGNVYTVKDLYGDGKQFKIRLEKTKSYHSSYSGIDF